MEGEKLGFKLQKVFPAQVRIRETGQKFTVFADKSARLVENVQCCSEQSHQEKKNIITSF